MTHTAGALVVLLALGLALTSSPQGPRRQYIEPRSGSEGLPFSGAVLTGNTLYISGTIGVDPATGRVPADLEQEIRIAMDTIKSRLEAAGMTMDDLVYVQVYCPDLSLYARFNAVYRSYFSKEFPARAFIGSGPLLLGGHFEIQAIAVKR